MFKDNIRIFVENIMKANAFRISEILMIKNYLWSTDTGGRKK